MKDMKLTQQPLIHVDGTPNEGYPIRILMAYRENCNCNFMTGTSPGTSPPNPLVDLMNLHNKQRAEILDRAIKFLEAVILITSKEIK